MHETGSIETGTIETDAGAAAPAPLPFEPLPAFQASPLTDDTESAKCHGKRIGILIVTYNAVTTLTKVLKRISPNVWNNVEEIAIFDDASQDATYELAMGIKALRQLPKLTVLKHDRNLGYGGNQKTGYRYFMEKGFDIAVLLHGDGQYAPEILSHLYRPIVTGKADAVFGSRMMKTYGGPLKGGMPLYKYLGNRILSVCENAALGLDLTEFHSGYRAYSLAALRKIDFTHMTNDFHFDTEIIIKLNHQGFTISEVPIPTYYGTEICYVNGLRYARDVLRAVGRYRRTCRSVARCPEFAEYFVNYPIKRSKSSSHDYALSMVGQNREVLDIGCGEGDFAAELKKNGNRVTGIDLLPHPANVAAFERYFSANLDQGIVPIVKALEGQRFDRVLLLDILEHLRAPGRVLTECRALLDAKGEVIVSLPNIANITVRLMLLFGRFDYTERGILDGTHVRFFTRKTARRFLREHGYEILRERCTVMPLELVLGLAPTGLAMRIVNRLLSGLTRLMPGLLGYQIVMAARKS
ncbi:MAG TPA: bifunctional glycosyltransferase/class I SAM-dependent methyltransferase [Bryobacteraceae bacterium]|nr:bifunctional glycosyltransferase/class I SAM-dependent methyltransferase [Bryobacteraceae bacterium]